MDDATRGAWEFVLHYWKASAEILSPYDNHDRHKQEILPWNHMTCGRISDLTTIELGNDTKSSGKMCCEDHVLRWSSSCANFFAASTLMRSRFFQTAKVFMATSQLVLPMLIMDSKASRSFIRFYSWLVFLRVGPFLFQEFYICTYIELYNIEQSYWVTIATSWHLGVKWAHTRRNHF